LTAATRSILQARVFYNGGRQILPRYRQQLDALDEKLERAVLMVASRRTPGIGRIFGAKEITVNKQPSYAEVRVEVHG
jgi:hypothetical protein